MTQVTDSQNKTLANHLHPRVPFCQSLVQEIEIIPTKKSCTISLTRQKKKKHKQQEIPNLLSENKEEEEKEKKDER
jgi:hypothetical protein